MKTTNYMLVCSDTPEQLANDIGSLLYCGWRLQGGVSIAFGPATGRIFYAQALVK